jgi:hypothetical protein
VAVSYELVLNGVAVTIDSLQRAHVPGGREEEELLEEGAVKCKEHSYYLLFNHGT